MLTTIQDLGRRGYQRYGVPVSGAMDWFAASLANILVGNGMNTPLLEVTVIGPVIETTEDCCFAVTGATFSPKLNGQPVPMNSCIHASAGSRIEMGFAALGTRGYIAFGGGFDIPLDMGSASTYIKARLGGLNGGPLQNGDAIPVRYKEYPANLAERQAPPRIVPDYSASPIVRIVTEMSTGYFADNAVAMLTSECYTVSADSDRMGCRLEGPAIPYAGGCDGNIISDGIAIGSIQVAGGRPIVLMADRQTTGGYTKIGAVIMADLPLVAQLKPSEKLRFEVTCLGDAQAAYGAMRVALSELDRRINL